MSRSSVTSCFRFCYLFVTEKRQIHHAMKLDAWTTGEAVDKARRKRLTVGYTVGAVTVAVGLLFITYSAHGQAFEPDDTLDVTLTQPPMEVAPDPEPEPEPEPKPRIVKEKKRRKGAKVSMSTPQGVPDEVPAEAEPGGNPYEGDMDDVFGEGGGGDAAPDTKPVVKRIKKKVARKKAAPAPVFVSEREASTPPRAISRRRPAYPAEARSEGVEGVVVVRFLVSRSGSVTDVRVVRGPQSLTSAVVAAVKQWRFQPGTFEGRPTAMWQTARFPFRLRA